MNFDLPAHLIRLNKPHTPKKIRTLKIIVGWRETRLSKLEYIWISMLLNPSAMGLKISGKMLMRTEKISKDAKI
jgi:hypothetical protein